MHFINTSDLLGPDWRFLEPYCHDPEMIWEIHSGTPRNRLERTIRRPALSRYRAAFTAALSARNTSVPVLVSHLPGMAAATNLMRRKLCPSVPQIAFAFNFTELPTGPRLSYLRRALQGIDEFVVFSSFERSLYATHFDIPEERIRFLPWAMETPVPGLENPVQDLGGYLCAIGGEGRDYALLAHAMRERPSLKMVIVGRPYSVSGIDVPSNVTVFTNLSAAKTWRIAADSLGLVIPLKTDTTACGHITLVGAQRLGLPLIITRSRGVEDYVEDGKTAHMVPVGDKDALIHAIDRMYQDQDLVQRISDRAFAQAEKQNSLSAWVTYFQETRQRLSRL